MNQLLRSLGSVIVLLGVLTLVIYKFAAPAENTLLIVAALLFVGGIGAHIFLNKKYVE